MSPKSRFIGQPIVVEFDKPPLFAKKPNCPDRFIWDGVTYEIVAVVGEWRDYARRGRMSDNMRPSHAAMAALRGSWGVGRYFFRVRSQDGRLFEIYYDRAPKDANSREGAWFLSKESME
jgi:hypothetical protein